MEGGRAPKGRRGGEEKGRGRGEAQRKVEVKVRAHTEKVAWSQCKWLEGSQLMQKRKHKEVALLWAGKKKAWIRSLATDDEEDKDKEEEWVEGEENCDMLEHGCGLEVESHVQMECMLGTLEEIQECLNPEFALEEPEGGSEEEYEEEEVAEAAMERERWKAQSGEELEVEKEV
ncbi:hypothetical protein BS17DRAFT_820404 [Gyrodon lividus]|nr:hypothetical protein BS17DRAFT_820404 [Gyrodon lividus]